jgi:hypothetical protein
MAASLRTEEIAFRISGAGAWSGVLAGALVLAISAAAEVAAHPDHGTPATGAADQS